MANNSSYVNINFRPFITISILVVVLIFLGSYWNQIRTQAKLSKIQTHTEAIYNAHKAEFVIAVKSSEKNSYGYFINQVNIPEKGLYSVRILVKDDHGGYSIRGNWYGGALDSEEANNLKLILSEEKTVGTTKNIFINTPSEEINLFAFTPINEDETVIGYVMVSVRKNQDL